MKRSGKSKGIRRQILTGVLSVVLLAVVSFMVIAAAGLVSVKKEIIENNSQVIKGIAENEMEKVLDDISTEMMNQCENMSLICQQKLYGYMEELQICTDTIAGIYQEPERYGETDITAPGENTREKLCMYYSINSQLKYEDYSQLIKKIGCSTQVLQSVYESSSLNSIYYTTKEGILFSFDSNSGEVLDKLEEGQSPLHLHGYEPRETEWYKNSCDSPKGEIQFSSTYLDSTNNLVVTCSQPVYMGQEYMGVMAIDIFLGNLEEELIGYDDIKYDGTVIIADNVGNVVVSPNINKDEGKYEQINILTNQNEDITEVAEAMVSGLSNMELITYNNQDSMAVYFPIECSGWSIALVFNRDAAMSAANDSYRVIMAETDQTAADVENMIWNMTLFFFTAAAVIIGAGTIFAGIVSGRITRPMNRLIKDVNIIRKGDLDYRVDIHTGNEFESLGDAFNKMTVSLKEYMSNLARATADKERIATELNVAADIQLSLLPGKTREFSDEKAFEVSAFMKPAKEVGGDFYDYFMTDEKHLWVVVADVSGKGIPAALFMMMGKTLIKNMAGTMDSPGQILEAVNNQLNEHNEAMMFITSFVAVIDLETGQVIFANGGHNFPFYSVPQAGFKMLKTAPDVALAVMDNTAYENHNIYLARGGSIFLYTDGVTEAMNEEGELYGEQRLLEVLDKAFVANLRGNEFINYIREDIKIFSGEAMQADDITMVYLTFIEKKSQDRRRLKVKAELSCLNNVLDFIEEKLKRGGYSSEFISTMKFIGDEIFANIAMYAYGDTKGEAWVTVNIIEETGMAELIFEDMGRPYNPLEQENPDITKKPEEREEGGLGIYLVKSMADSMEYEYREKKNVLKICKYTGKRD